MVCGERGLSSGSRGPKTHSIKSANNRLIQYSHQPTGRILLSMHRSVKSIVVSAAVFRRDADTWSRQAESLPPCASCQDRFGHNTDVYTDILVVRLLNDRHQGFSTGAAYVHVQNGNMSSFNQNLAGVEVIERLQAWCYNRSCCGSSCSSIANRCRHNPQRRSL